MNNRKEEGFVMVRLDRAFATADWVNSYPHYSLHNLPIVDSDHGPILLNFEQLLPFRYRPFRFELMWINHPNYKDMILQAWEIQTKGLEVLLNREETMWAQKTKRNWILNGDRNTRYFQTVVRQKRARSRIFHIKDEDGLLLEDPLEIENRLVNHFKSSYEDTTLLSVDSILSELQS